MELHHISIEYQEIATRKKNNWLLTGAYSKFKLQTDTKKDKWSKRVSG
jgi:hypothetical protein